MANLEDADGTAPVRSGQLPVKRIAVDVLEGPSAGLHFMATDDHVTVGSASRNDVCLQDPTVSRFHMELRRRDGRLTIEDLNSTNGCTIGEVTVRGARATIRPGARVQLGASALIVRDGGVTVVDHGSHTFGELHGKSRVMRRLFSVAKRVAQSEASVLLRGESGTGKELLARALHRFGPRADSPFVAVDCGALTPSLVASELFGHERGAFTGAERQHLGAFERAHGGTLFLDEVGELPRALQATMLGALERRSVRRVGGTDSVEVDVRVVAATHRDLRAAVNADTFRLDLYHRLAVVQLELPALRERLGDIPALITHFLRQEGDSRSAEEVLGRDFLAGLTAHHWPGNVRELRNLVRATLATDEPGALRSAAPLEAAQVPTDLSSKSYREVRRGVLDGFERRYLTALLDQSGGSVRKAAKIAKMDRGYLIELLRRHGLK